MEKKSYAMGVAIGSNYVGTEWDAAAFADGFMNITSRQPLKLDMEEIQRQLELFQQQMDRGASQAIEEEKRKGKAFLDANRMKEGVQETASGLQYKVLRLGTGKSPKADSPVTVHYVGRLLDGTVFDSSRERGDSPISFALNQVISGWTEGLQLMREGGLYEFYIPSHLAYGDRGAGQLIKGGATLVFEVELIAVG
ncbi:MAG: FKBP-type peptidyl-prolyl cis-trans isomerase [Bacteroidales bacterium]|nr:FKBP-type peptidyl-prolyl cis-trans isomerase [Bacteroidales bacterium]MBP5396394.1 FKBP-type peptidyl-prolyl cis-trans isomerase [Bacteroidales bacterium]MBP5614010.1 FKBP-type peptidyl-prolyl cis-trans isomerase [Bacteroidales bacterium]MBQ6666909.1 FKBP-type peptidyl-prolyl cis-trans isomerase [Bacteroidales bacterium]MBR4491560.1 FKBP-type peptidyl-prolyl cis-trans isomerase [Bacteroidales bacterium]